MCGCDLDEPKFYAVSHPRARKPLRCRECRGIIAPGERYARIAAKFDSISTCTTCLDCEAWGEAFMEAQAEGDPSCVGFAWGSLWECIADFAHDEFRDVYAGAGETGGET